MYIYMHTLYRSLLSAWLILELIFSIFVITRICFIFNYFLSDIKMHNFGSDAT